MKEEKPRSRVMPRSLLWGCLSRAAVERVVDRAATAHAPGENEGVSAGYHVHSAPCCCVE